MNVVFLSPSYPLEMQDYVRGLAEVGAKVYGVGDSPVAGLPPKVRRYLTDYLQVPGLLREDEVVEQTLRWIGDHPIDRVEGIWEPLVIAAAKIRERLGIPGMSLDTVRGFRDKDLMKQRIAAAGLRVPKAKRVRKASEAWEGAEEIGYPLIIKPIDGAGSADTYRVNNEKELEIVLGKIKHVPEVSCEEFIEGREFTYDTVCIEGTPAYENVAEYLPRPLIARSYEHLSPVIVTVRDLSQPHLQGGLTLGRGVLKALGMGSGFTHMEWYLTDKGEVVFGEIGCRPGGAHLVDQMNFTSDIDLFREWARVVCWGSFEAKRERKYNVAIMFKRAQGQGKITSIQGLGHYMHQFGQHVCVENLLKPGQWRRDWTQTLVSDGFLILRHPDWDTTLKLSEYAAEGIQMYAGGQ